MGHGTITCAHGVLPVPAPAALEILREARGVMTDGGVARELCTPTGVAGGAEAERGEDDEPPRGAALARDEAAGVMYDDFGYDGAGSFVARERRAARRLVVLAAFGLGAARPSACRARARRRRRS
jgi:hypothetical protein